MQRLEGKANRCKSIAQIAGFLHLRMRVVAPGAPVTGGSVQPLGVVFYLGLACANGEWTHNIRCGCVIGRIAWSVEFLGGFGLVGRFWTRHTQAGDDRDPPKCMVMMTCGNDISGKCATFNDLRVWTAQICGIIILQVARLGRVWSFNLV